MRKLLFVFIALLFIMPSSVSKAEEKKRECLALNYHRIVNNSFFISLMEIYTANKELNFYSIKVNEFNNQMEWLKRHDAHFISFEELVDYKKKGYFPERCVWVNFDDMDVSIYKYAHPILLKHKIPATGFIITGHTEGKSFNNLKLIHADKLQEMEDSGIWSFGSHTHDLHYLHKGISQMIRNEEAVKSDFNRSKKFLKKTFDKPIDALAYPYGQYNDEIKQQLKVKYAFTLKETPIHIKDNNLELPRILISRDAFDQVVKNWEGFKYEEKS